MAFFGLQKAHLAVDNGFFGLRNIELRIKLAGVFVMSCVDGFYAVTRKNILLMKKAVKQFIIYFSTAAGCE